MSAKQSGSKLSFVKMQGCGNDFVLLDNRVLAWPREKMPDLAKALCSRYFGVGADGLILLSAAKPGAGVDYTWDFYNADGSRAEMCGNGARCAAKLAWKWGLAPDEHVLGTDAGAVAAKVFLDSGLVEVQLTPPKDFRRDIALAVLGREFTAHFVNTGVPHTVIAQEDLAGLDVAGLGRAVRFHEAFAPAGTNVNFIQVTGPRSLNLRTYERGVEAETYACGTGACASVYVTHALGLTGPEAEVTTTGGERLGVRLAEGRIYLKGAAQIVFEGSLDLRDLGF